MVNLTKVKLMAKHLFQPGNTLATGRPAGSVNKVPVEIRAMIRQALDGVGGVSYLQQQAIENPVAFMTLIGKVIPTDVKISLVMPEARVYPLGLPQEESLTIDNEQTGLPITSEAMDSLQQQGD